MTQYYALLSLVFMIEAVFLFDRTHFRRRNAQFCRNGLLNRHDLEILQTILAACQDT
jgi:hypothetical protein